MRRRDVSWPRHIRIMHDMYQGAKTRVETACGTTTSFSVRVDAHHGSVLSPFLFILKHDHWQMEEQAPQCILLADDKAIMGSPMQTWMPIWNVSSSPLRATGSWLSRRKVSAWFSEGEMTDRWERSSWAASQTKTLRNSNTWVFCSE